MNSLFRIHSRLPRLISVKYMLTLVILVLTAGMVYCVYNSEEFTLPLNDQLFVAASSGDLEECRALLRRGASIMARDTNGSTPLMCAASAGKVEVVQLLIDAGAEVGANDRFDMTPLLYGVRGGSVPTVALLLNYGADAGTCATWRDQSAIAYADQCGNDAVAEFLRTRQKVVPAGYLKPRDDRRVHSMLIGS